MIGLLDTYELYKVKGDARRGEEGTAETLPCGVARLDGLGKKWQRMPSDVLMHEKMTEAISGTDSRSGPLPTSGVQLKRRRSKEDSCLELNH